MQTTHLHFHITMVHFGKPLGKLGIHNSPPTFRNDDGTWVVFNNQPFLTGQCLCYLGINIDRQLTWSAHIKNKTRTLNDRFRLLRPFVTSKNIKLPTKLLLYKLLLIPIWSYDLQLWGSTKVSNTNRIQRFQSKVFRVIFKAPFYVSNNTLHSDFNLPTVTELSKLHYKRFNIKLIHHCNPLIAQILSSTIPGKPRKILRRQWCRIYNMLSLLI
jgi:hypothetical protein